MSLFNNVRFVTSVAELTELDRAPLAMVPEIAFVGRSNAGKSSTINVLTNRRQLAFASKTPGRTQLLNFFALEKKNEDGDFAAQAYLVDLPGYGFAKVDDATRDRWDQLVGGYLQVRRMLKIVVLVMDSRRPLTRSDEDLIEWLARRERPDTHLVMLLNKADQLIRRDRDAVLKSVKARADLLHLPTSVMLFSAMKREGVEELRTLLEEIV